MEKAVHSRGNAKLFAVGGVAAFALMLFWGKEAMLEDSIFWTAVHFQSFQKTCIYTPGRQTE